MPTSDLPSAISSGPLTESIGFPKIETILQKFRGTAKDLQASFTACQWALNPSLVGESVLDRHLKWHDKWGLRLHHTDCHLTSGPSTSEGLPVAACPLHLKSGVARWTPDCACVAIPSAGAVVRKVGRHPAGACLRRTTWPGTRPHRDLLSTKKSS